MDATQIVRAPVKALRPLGLSSGELLVTLLMGTVIAVLSVVALAGRVPPASHPAREHVTPDIIALWAYGNDWTCGEFFPVGNRLLKSCKQVGGPDGVLSFNNDLSDGKFVLIEKSAPASPAPTPVWASATPITKRGGP